jgi:hypothetical protein
MTDMNMRPPNPTGRTTSTQYVTIPRAAALTGLSEKAIRRKIENGTWAEGREYRRAPDGGIFISITGYQQWVEQRVQR